VPAPTASRPRFQLATLVPSWLPLRAPSVHLVLEIDGELVGSCRALEEPHRDDWVITELEAAESPAAPEIRYALLAAVVEAGADHGVARYHAACSDVRENLELFGQNGFMAYGQEEIMYRPPEPLAGARSWLRELVWRNGQRSGRDADAVALHAAGAPDAWHLFDLWTHCTPPAIARLEGYGAADWESVGQEATVPRSSLNPLMHFSGVNAWLLPGDPAHRRLRAAWCLPHRSTLPAHPRPRRDRWGTISAKRARQHGERRDRCRNPGAGANI